MLKDNQNRNLSEVFRELQEIKNSPDLQTTYLKKAYNEKKTSNSKNKNGIISLISPHIIIALLVVFIFTVIFCNKDILAKSDTPEYEINNNSLNIQNIISENANINTFKEQSIKEYDVVFATVYNNNPKLPKGEEVVTQEGKFGKEIVTSVRTYKNQELIDELILERKNISKPTSQLVDVGTSKFLAKHKVHIGDTMYVVNDEKLKKSADSKSDDVADVKESIDVKLLELYSEDWCKVSFDDSEGYIQTSNLTSASSTPSIVEKNRILRIKLKVNIDMELNKSSNLTKDDFKKIFTNLPQDTNNIFKDNYEVFYEADKKYNINGIFLASIAIHESGWGASTIAGDKKNLFGYGAYDNSPYESAYAFSDYSNGIETVAKALVKYYLNPAGTKIYDNETAEGTYYDSPTVKSVNTRYASDPDWHTKVFNYMQLLYDKL